MDFKEALNEEQYAAVTAPDGPSLVIAAAGTGKTRTLIYRLAWLAKERGLDPKQVLLLTFTNKAAKEMLGRAEALVGFPFGNRFSGTFHHFGNRLLRLHGGLLGYPRDFTILDADDSARLLAACAEELKIDKKHFPKPQVLLSIFGVISGQEGDLETGLMERFGHSGVAVGDVLDVHALYQRHKQEQHAMDFDDLLLRALELLRGQPRVLELCRDEFRHILVDEYQDTNAVQAALVDLLAGERRNVMVVGDDFQSIYSWRGADFRNFIAFARHRSDVRVFKLQTNYRSTPEILAVANAAIRGNPDQFQKELHAVRPPGFRPRLLRPRDGTEQARQVISAALDLKRQGIAFAEMCVLYRSHFHALELQMELTRAAVPYVVTSGVRFFEQAHIKDVCAALRVLVNPGDQLAFSRLLELLPKVGKKTAAKIFQRLNGRVALQRGEVCAQVAALLPVAAKPVWAEMEPVFTAFRNESLDGDPGEVIYRFNRAFYAEYMLENFDNAKYRAEDIDGLIDFCAKFDSAAAFLNEIALLTNNETEPVAPAEGVPSDSLRLSTVHQAKGLEFKAVFVLFLCEEMFPAQKALEESGDQEERRLFYVAVTRAEDRLLLCAPQMRRQRDGGVIFLEPSRFLQEMPDGLLEE